MTYYILVKIVNGKPVDFRFSRSLPKLYNQVQDELVYQALLDFGRKWRSVRIQDGVHQLTSNFFLIVSRGVSR